MSIIDKLPLTSHDIAADRLEQFRTLFPEVFSEGKIDHDALHRALGQWIDPGKERFGLSWPGKAECMRVIQSPSVGTLLPMPEESVNFDTSENLIIEGDNLEVLKLLQTSYYGKVKMIYIDPPYNTGNEFIYPDNYREGLDEYLKFSGQVDAEGYKTSTNTETGGRYHSKWLSMMYPRLFLAKNLLRDDGVIFVSIDDNEVHNLRGLMNEVFGEESFLISFVWQRRQMSDSRNEDRASTDHEYVLCYKRQDFKLKGTAIDKSKYSNPDNDPRGSWFSADLTGLANKQERPNLHYDLVNPKTGISHPPSPTRGWSCAPETMAKLIAEDRIIWPPKPEGRPRHKKFLNEVTRHETGFSSWLNVGQTTEGTRAIQLIFDEKIFPFSKPLSLIKALIEQATEDHSGIIMDFFAGSGTTAQGILDLNRDDGGNRRFILVQLPEKNDHKDYPTIAHITRERVRRVITKLNDADVEKLDLVDTAKQDRGFKSFRLSSSNFKVWDGDAAKEADVNETLSLFTDNVKSGRSQQDILYELLLKAGFPLTAPLEKLTLAGKEVFSIDGGELLVCLDNDLTLTVIEAMVAKGPRQILCLDEGFHGNDQLKVNALQTVKSRNRREDSDIVFRVV